MAVYLVYRSAYETPLGRRIIEFEEKTLLDWFLKNWSYAAEFPEDKDQWYTTAREKAKRLGLECVHGFTSIFELMAEHGDPPRSARQLRNWLHHKPYPEGLIYATEHAIQAATDDDELDLAVLMFDDVFASRHRERVTFLLHEKLKMPTRCIADCGRFVWRGSANNLDPKRRRPGATYVILLVIEDTSWLTDLLGPFRFQGIRLPDLVPFLESVPESVIEKSEAIPGWHSPGKWPQSLIQLRELAGAVRCKTIRELLEAHERSEQQEFEALDQTTRTWQQHRHLSLIQSSKHFAQIAFRTTMTLYDGSQSFDRNLQWYFFDDLWAASHRDLAKSLLWYAIEQLPLFSET